MSATKGNSAITTEQMVQQNGKSLLGTPPNIFDGNRENAKEFMHSFKRWWTLNDDNAAFAIPYKCVTLCLSYMRGKNVEDLSTLQMALVGYQLERQKIEAKIQEIQAQLKGKHIPLPSAIGGKGVRRASSSPSRSVRPNPRIVSGAQLPSRNGVSTEPCTAR